MKHNKIIKIKLSTNPDIKVRAILPTDTAEIIKDKQKKMFICSKKTYLTVYFEDKTKLTIYANKNYTFDGATIPFNIGKADMKLQIPALFHDIMCEQKWLVNYDRRLSSEIFYYLLLYCHKNKIIANIMLFFVDNFQKLMNWNNKNV